METTKTPPTSHNLTSPLDVLDALFPDPFEEALQQCLKKSTSRSLGLVLVGSRQEKV